jgi:7-carboxy-7-deazaguanine synthase
MSLNEVLAQLKKWNCKNVLLTGGEPLLQRGTLPLIQKLRALGYEVSIETHGEQSIEIYKSLARIVMDIKTPGSKMNREGWIKNLPHLKAEDEVKFVITSWEDYNFAKKILKEFKFNTQNILFSPVVYNKHSPLKVPEFDSTLLAEKILEDQLPIRMQLQLHKILWGTEKNRRLNTKFD